MEKKQVPAIRFQGFTDAWEQRKLGDIYIERNERGNAELDILSVSIHHGISQNELDTDELGKSVRRSDDKSLYKHVYYGDLVFNMMRAWQGAIGVVKNEGMVSPAYISAIPDDSVFPEFMDYCLRRKCIINQINNLSYGVTDFRKRLYWEPFTRVTITMPSVDEQRKITDIFRQLDHLITLHQRKYEKLLKVKKSMLEKMFPRDGADVPEIRFDGFTDAWEQRKFIDIATRESSVCTSAVDILSVEYEDVVSEEGRLNKDIRSKETVKSGITFDGSQVLYGKLRPYLHNWLNPDFKGVAVGDWWVLKPINMDKNFLYRLIQTQQFDNIANQSSGSKMPRADWNLISNSEFMVPPSKEEQSKIGRYFDSLDRLITLHQRKLEKLKNIKKSLLEKMFV